MPIIHTIDHGRRIVVARWQGTVTEADLFAYQQEAWARPEVAGFNELINMLDVETLPDTGPVGPVTHSAAALTPAITSGCRCGAPRRS